MTDEIKSSTEYEKFINGLVTKWFDMVKIEHQKSPKYSKEIDKLQKKILELKLKEKQDENRNKRGRRKLPSDSSSGEGCETPPEC